MKGDQWRKKSLNYILRWQCYTYILKLISHEDIAHRTMIKYEYELIQNITASDVL